MRYFAPDLFRCLSIFGGWNVPDADAIPFGDSVGCGEVRGGTMKAPPLTLPLTPWRGLRYGLFGRVFLLLLHGDRGNMWF